MRPGFWVWLGLWLVVACGRGEDAVWQWSVPMGEGRAFLWIPERGERVRAVVLAQHNMIELGILEHPRMRATLRDLGIAIVFVAPPFDRVFQFDRGAGARVEALLHELGNLAGYDELATVPVVPLGHSACASFPWNLAAWNPGRTLAVLSVKGDAPQTDLTGSGAPNPAWGDRVIDGIPGLMVMGEHEWWEARVEPLLRFRARHPRVPLTVLADAGHGHFDASDELVAFLALFIRKAAEARLPLVPGDPLRPVEPAAGWRVERWYAERAGTIAPAPASRYTGEPADAFWCFDEETARAVQALQTRGAGGVVQQVDFVQDGALLPIATAHAGVQIPFIPSEDGVSFALTGDFIVPLPPRPRLATKDRPPPPTTSQPELAPVGAHALGEVRVSPIVGPVVQVGPNQFRVALNRTHATIDKRGPDIWLRAWHSGDAHFRGAVQQGLLRLPDFREGDPQLIQFAELPDQPRGVEAVPLNATSSSGRPVSFYVREGPAFVRDGQLHVTTLPPRAKLPITVTVVAWQLGRGGASPLQTAVPVERSFRIVAR